MSGKKIFRILFSKIYTVNPRYMNKWQEFCIMNNSKETSFYF